MNSAEKRNELKRVKEFLKTGKPKSAFQALGDISSPYDEFALQSQYSKIFRSMDRDAIDLRPLRMALLGSSTLDHFADVFTYWMAREGFSVELYLGPYNTFRQEVLQEDSDLYRFDPDFIWFFTNGRDVCMNVDPASPAEAIDRAVREAVEGFETLWEKVGERSKAHVIQNNADLPLTRVFGNFEGTAQWARLNLLRRFNLELAAAIRPGVSLFDLDFVASSFGKHRWCDYRYWYHSKHAFSLDASGAVAFHAARLVGAHKGTAKKCIILDLDNTLWGGVIGDDGIENIRLGNGPDGEAFVDFQEYLADLKARGILLAVCSKNEEDAAKEPFLRHPDMRLKLEDIVVFRANWNNKADNIRDIVAILNIGMDSIVFVDDNPAERDLVKRELPAVTVPEMPEDPSEFVHALDALCLFETVSFSPEDMQRSSMYRDNANRKEYSRQFTDLSDYLRNLDMEAIVGCCDPFHITRMAQLVNKSNQFHLTGTRYSEGELAALDADPQYMVRYFKLKDRFGDNGLVSVVVLAQTQDALEVDTWVMSCRVLARGMEEFICREIMKIACEKGCCRIRARYVPSKKNRLVANLYERLRFQKISEDREGIVHWELPLDDGTPDFQVHIRYAKTAAQEELS
ncbi:MAG TPA: HAD-IIIC family phosphatase [Desulfomonilaceae bacterium]|nr:HAD-IIIC family phosphatase [Desulfomonilaceae bacterium]